MHSSTKYFGGHSDVMGGAVVTRDRGGLSDKLRDYQQTAGSVPSPFDCWLIRRSLTTLSCRLRAQTHNASRIAGFLQSHKNVERVFYPGLDTHPGHAIALRQMKGGFGAMLSFNVRGGRDAAFAVAAKMELFIRATSLGGVESLVEHRASVEGPHTVTPQNLLRSFGGIGERRGSDRGSGSGTRLSVAILERPLLRFPSLHVTVEVQQLGEAVFAQAFGALLRPNADRCSTRRCPCRRRRRLRRCVKAGACKEY